jgi:hypothetical protein
VLRVQCHKSVNLVMLASFLCNDCVRGVDMLSTVLSFS